MKTLTIDSVKLTVRSYLASLLEVDITLLLNRHFHDVIVTIMARDERCKWDRGVYLNNVRMWIEELTNLDYVKLLSIAENYKFELSADEDYVTEIS
jgi:hypothetical protein